MAIIPLKRTKRRVITLFLAFIASVVCYIGLSSFIEKDIQAVKIIEQETKQKSELKARQSSLIILMKDSEEDRKELQSYLIDENGVVEFVSDLEHIASSTNVTLDITSLGIVELPNGVTVPHNTFEVLRAQLELRGRWQGIVHFLSLVEHMPKHHYISDLDFTAGEGEWSASLMLRALKLKE
jgi:hypothetical protein